MWDLPFSFFTPHTNTQPAWRRKKKQREVSEKAKYKLKLQGSADDDEIS